MQFTIVIFALLLATRTLAEEQTPIGKDFILRVGPGFDRISALGIKEDLDAIGCPTTVVASKRKNRIIVQFDYKKSAFKTVASASATAQDWCLEDLNKD